MMHMSRNGIPLGWMLWFIKSNDRYSYLQGLGIHTVTRVVLMFTHDVHTHTTWVCRSVTCTQSAVWHPRQH